MARIAFFGTPDFAATQFVGLISYCEQNGHTIAFAVCQPDRPLGRSQTPLAPPVKTVALKHKILVFQPETLKSGAPDGDSFFQMLKESELDLAIVVAYGRIIPTRMLVLPRCGFVNVHASLLPRWRGASPIQRAIQAGDKLSGVSIMDLVPEMDAGDVYAMRSLSILPEDTAATLTSRLAILGLETLCACIDPILKGELKKTPQPQTGITFAPKLEKKDGLIDWKKSAAEIVWHERAMDPWPQAYSYLKGKAVKLFGAQVSGLNAKDKEEGTVVALDESMLVKCADGCVSFNFLQLEGRNKMRVKDACNGKLIRVGDQFSTESLSL
jgi:methionyl-tRNA formyltransferase